MHVIGPGLGVSSRASDIVCDALAWASPLIIDADALNLIATSTTLQDSMRARAARGHATVMTPHPLEAARLLGQPLSDVTHDRLRAARTLAKTFHAIVVLKGVGSIICAPTGAWQMNITGNPGLASGGTGDVLAGLLGGLIAQHPQASILETVCGGVWLHGRAADHLVAQGIGPNGLTASELAPALRVLINRPSRAALPAS